ncbi:MAG: dTMP kinase [Victivallales bacterium]|nr:dTMP kinase [Victivallales bacterium]
MTFNNVGSRGGRGLFITFEGPEGSGKTTQLQLLKKYLEGRGHRCVATREPGGTALGERLREVIKHHDGEETIADEAELLLIAAGRAQHVRKLIEPSLEAGKIVLCDRFYDSTTAYQGYARGIDINFVSRLNEYASCGFKPDITFLLDLVPEEGFERTSRRIETLLLNDRIESAGIDFHLAVYDGFHKIAAREPERVKIVPADGPVELISQRVRELFDNAFPEI